MSIKTSTQRTYILVHGAWHGSWCWAELVKKLQSHGHETITPDLPGHGGDTIHKSINLNTYIDYIEAIVLSQNNEVILVGHSMAGVVISQVAEKIPDRIKKLVYIAAFLPEDGCSLMDEARQANGPGVSRLTKVDESNNLIILEKNDFVHDIFFNRCDLQHAARATSLLQANEPFQPFIDKVEISEEKFGRVKKLYIECSDDNAVTLADQCRMHGKFEVDTVRLDADHSPFISCTDELAHALTS